MSYSYEEGGLLETLDIISGASLEPLLLKLTSRSCWGVGTKGTWGRED